MANYALQLGLQSCSTGIQSLSLPIVHGARYDSGIKCDSLSGGGEGGLFLLYWYLSLKALLRQILDGGEEGKKVNESVIYVASWT